MMELPLFSAKSGLHNLQTMGHMQPSQGFPVANKQNYNSFFNLNKM
jgi:hypothetical protein